MSSNMALPKKQSYSLQRYKGTNLFEDCEIDEIQRMEVKADDIWVLSFPRSGTTLTQEIVYMLKSNQDTDTARKVPLDDRFPFLDLYRPEMQHFKGLRHIEAMASPRLIKSHLHRHVLPKHLFDSKCKKIYVMRNPKDVAVSCAMLTKFLRQLDPDEDINGFIKDWLHDKAYGTPWWRHVRDFWMSRHDPTLLILKYEEIVQDMRGTIRKVADHIDVNVTENDIRNIAEHCSFNNMKNNRSTNAGWMMEQHSMDARFGGHIRQGKIGGWRTYISKELAEKFDEMVDEKLGDTELSFYFG